MKIRIQMKAEAETSIHFSERFTKAKAEVAQLTRDRDNAQSALDLAQSKLTKLVESQLQRYAI
jgi:hypothetical protein